MNILKAITSAISRCAAVVLLFVCLPHSLHATSVLQVDVEQLLNDAAVIFEGEVITSEAKWNADNTYISTWITFRVDDVLKGELPSATITQSFAGGTVDGTTLQVSGMVYPQPGEMGIYFIEDPENPQVNPLVGWSQGHFKIERDDSGTERVLTEKGDPIQGLEEVSQPNVQGRSIQQETTLPLSEGAARGLRVGTPEDAAETAMDKENFKAALQTRLSLMKAEKEAPAPVEKD